MKRFNAFCVCLAVAIALSSTTALLAEDTDELNNQAALDRRRGPYFEFVASYDYDTLLSKPEIHASLVHLFGDDLSKLTDRLRVRGPIDYVSGCLVLEGNAPHKGMSDMAILLVCGKRAIVYGAIMENKVIALYSEQFDGDYDDYRDVPDSILRWAKYYLRYSPDYLSELDVRGANAKIYPRISQ